MAARSPAAGYRQIGHPAIFPRRKEGPRKEASQLRPGGRRSHLRHFLLIIWLLLIPRYPFLLLGPGIVYLHLSPFQLEPVWMQFYWWIVGLNIFQFGWNSSTSVGRWQDPQPWMTHRLQSPRPHSDHLPHSSTRSSRSSIPELDQQHYGRDPRSDQPLRPSRAALRLRHRRSAIALGDRREGPEHLSQTRGSNASIDSK